jgi:hypothetical protein
MAYEQSHDPTTQSPKAPNPPQEGKTQARKLGRDLPGQGLDTGVDVGAIQPGASGDNDPLK